MTVAVLRHMSVAAQCLSHASLDMQNIANIFNAYAKVPIPHHKLSTLYCQPFTLSPSHSTLYPKP